MSCCSVGCQCLFQCHQTNSCTFITHKERVVVLCGQVCQLKLRLQRCLCEASPTVTSSAVLSWCTFEWTVINTEVLEVWLRVPGSAGGGWRWWCRAAVWWVFLCTSTPVPGPCPLWWAGLWPPGQHASHRTALMYCHAWGQMDDSRC